MSGWLSNRWGAELRVGVWAGVAGCAERDLRGGGERRPPNVPLAGGGVGKYVREDGSEAGVGFAVSMDTLRGAYKSVVPKGSSRVGVDVRFKELVEEEPRQLKRLSACGSLRRNPLFWEFGLAYSQWLDVSVEHPEVGMELKFGGGVEAFL